MACLGILGEARRANEAFNHLTLDLAQQVSELQGLCLLRPGDDPKERARTATALDRLAARLLDSEEELIALEAQVQRDLAFADEAKALTASLRSHERKAAQLCPKVIAPASPPRPEGSGSRDDASAAATEDSPPDLSHLEEAGGALDSAPTEADHVPRVGCPTEAELELVPRYMRGRLALAKLQAAVDAVQRALEVKATTLALPRHKQSVAVREKVLSWCGQECDEAAGDQFVTIEDIAEQKEVDMNTLKSALQVLRFTNHLRLINSGGVARYCVPSEAA
mmetsp:Transcript_16212/g.45982  ORF Transcript_16212/g.45982 Transcript_16212/m.45982 type:complete len:280 (-) Transcript_16212:129-968(-)